MHAHRLSRVFGLILILFLFKIEAYADPIDLSNATCPKPFVLTNGKCEITDETLAKVKIPEGCTDVNGLALEGGVCKRSAKAPLPQCPSVAGGKMVFKDGKCLFDSQVTSSASGDYVGDYFKIIGVPPDDPDRFGGPPGTTLKAPRYTEVRH